MRGHISALDGLRGVAILLVLGIHIHVQLDGSRPGRLLDYWLTAGWTGVDLFFVLSGFLITGMLWDAKGRPGYFWRFYARRALRIFPLYYLVLGFWFVVAPSLQGILSNQGIAGKEWWYLLYLTNLRYVLDGWPQTALRVAWSLSVEEQFYLIWPAVVLVCSRRRLMQLCAALIVLTPLLRFGLLLLTLPPAWAPPYVLMPARIDVFAVGAGIALIARRGTGWSPLSSWAPRVATITGPSWSQS